VRPQVTGADFLGRVSGGPTLVHSATVVRYPATSRLVTPFCCRTFLLA
jgi:hypothetical protein